MLTRKTYNAVAARLLAVYPHATTAEHPLRRLWSEVVESFIEMFTADNPAFDPARFRAACLPAGEGGRRYRTFPTKVVEEKSPLATSAELQAARAQYATDFVEIDEDARTSHGEDGVWVAAWVFLPKD